jgi:hypothetical protein
MAYEQAKKSLPPEDQTLWNESLAHLKELTQRGEVGAMLAMGLCIEANENLRVIKDKLHDGGKS